MNDEDHADDDADDAPALHESGAGHAMEGLGIDKGHDGVDDSVDTDDDHKSSHRLAGPEQGHHCGNDGEDPLGERDPPDRLPGLAEGL